MKKRIFVVATLLALMSTPAFAGDKYGALAYSSGDGAWGWWADANDQASASQNALSKCQEHGSGCKVVLEFWNTCAAFAVGQGGYGWAHNPDENAAQSSAVQYCSQHGTDCEVKVWACTSR
ncbi:MAG: DUF4189 domain-containing protein [Spirochaetia bacterium]|nr:DUF4189 domain-containing protein [Spirochaetia bacterium]